MAPESKAPSTPSVCYVYCVVSKVTSPSSSLSKRLGFLLLPYNIHCYCQLPLISHLSTSLDCELHMDRKYIFSMSPYVTQCVAPNSSGIVEPTCAGS